MIDFSHILIVLAGLAVFALSLLPIRWIVDSKNLSLGRKVYWSLVVACFPVLGALAWLAAGKSKA